MVRALLLDFDGLILDTETPVFESWCEVYAAFGQSLPRELWLDTVGTARADFDPLEHLRSLVDHPLPEAELQAARRRRRDEQLEALPPMPGVERWIETARARGFGLAVASSSPRDWVAPHLERLRLLDGFDALVTLEQVREAKPAPDLYLKALELLGAAPGEAVALEDSPKGVAAAKAAGVYCLAVPGPMTRDLGFAQADLVLESLEQRSLDEVLALLEGD